MGLWKALRGATAVSIVIDCEIWYSLAEFHHASQVKGWVKCFKIGALVPSLWTDMPCDEMREYEEMRQPPFNVKRPLRLGSEHHFFYTEFQIQTQENEPLTNPEGPRQRHTGFDFEGIKAMNASSTSDSQEKVFHACVSWAVTHFKHTLPQFSPFRDGKQEVEGCKSPISSGVCLTAVCLRGIFLFFYKHGHSCGVTGLCMCDWWLPPEHKWHPVWESTGRPQERPAPLFCPSLSTPIKSRNLQPKYISNPVYSRLQTAGSNTLTHFGQQKSIYSITFSLFV